MVRDGAAQRQPVTMGADRGDLHQVQAGLAGGESLVVSDATALREGVAVAIDPSS